MASGEQQRADFWRWYGDRPLNQRAASWEAWQAAYSLGWDTRTEMYDKLIAALKLMREALAGCFRVIATTPGLPDKLSDEFQTLGIPDGFGAKVQNLIAEAEAIRASPDAEGN